MSVYKGSQKIGDIYYGAGKTNCLTSFPKNVNWSITDGTLALKKDSKVYIPNGWDIGQVGIYGSPTIADGVVSGFSSANYLQLDNSLKSTNNAEYVFKFMTGNSTTHQYIAHAEYFINIEIDEYVVFYNWSGKTSVALFKPELNTTYWVKILVNGTSKTFSYSTDGVTYTGDKTITDSSMIYNNYKNYLFKLGFSSSVSTEPPFLGSIDLPECYIKINGELVWQGKKGNGKRIFDEKIIESDTSIKSVSANGVVNLYYCVSSNSFHLYYESANSSGTTAPTSDGTFYNTSDNTIWRYIGGSKSYQLSLPLGKITDGSGAITSINQHFSWFGFIGSTAFTLPNIEGLCSNGFNTDGTYKNVRGYEDEVQIHTYTSNWTRAKQPIFLQNGSIDFTEVTNDGYHEGTDRSAYDSLTYQCFYNTKENKTYRSGGTAGQWEQQYRTLLGYINMTAGVINSITHIGAKTNNTARKIARVYKGSTLVYGYAPNSIVVEKVSAGSKTYDIKVDGYYQIWLVGAGGGGIYNSSGNKGSSAAGNSGGYVNVKAYLKKGSYTVTVGDGGAAKGGLDWTGWGNNGGNTSITFNGKTLLLAGGGTANKVSYPSGYQQNSTISVANQINSGNFTLVQTVANQGGNKGGLGGNGSSPTGGASRYGGYGKGGNVYNRNSADAGGRGYVKIVAL